ncbi:MAG: hypothetical protein JNL79_31525 [Myxococcales bacterium]|nr:hypothetical protein [Myxococcales bacterium]
MGTLHAVLAGGRVALVAGLVGSAVACSAGGDKNDNATSLDGGTDGSLFLDGGLGDGIAAEGGNDDAACASVKYDGKKIPASLLIVLDRSASMDKDGKWTGAVSALKTALAAADDDLPVGILYYPEGKFDTSKSVGCILTPTAPGCPALLKDSGCTDIKKTPYVDIGPLKTTRALISSSMDATKPTGDNTPTRWALKNGWSIMQTTSAKGDRFVLLVTDGEPTTYSPAFGGLPEMSVECSDQATMEKETTGAFTGSPVVKTFVIGAPGSEKAATFLSHLAINGGTRRTPTCTTDCHYQIGSGSFSADLAKALAEITGKIATCIFEVPTGTDVDPAKVNVVLETAGVGADVLRDESHADGWDYTDGTKSKIELYGPKCDALKADPGKLLVKILLGCKTKVK